MFHCINLHRKWFRFCSDHPDSEISYQVYLRHKRFFISCCNFSRQGRINRCKGWIWKRTLISLVHAAVQLVTQTQLHMLLFHHRTILSAVGGVSLESSEKPNLKWTQAPHDVSPFKRGAAATFLRDWAKHKHKSRSGNGISCMIFWYPLNIKSKLRV